MSGPAEQPENTTPLSRTQALIERGMERGLHIGAQLYVSLAGRLVAEWATGDCRPGVPLTADSLAPWLSCTKPITAAAAMLQVQRGRLSLDDHVSQHVPEFAQGGKEAINVRHLLTHTAGFRGTGVVLPAATWEESIARVCAVPLEEGWTPGERAGYHPHTSSYMLAEIVRRLDGRGFGEFVYQEIFEPLGMRQSWIGMPLEEYRANADRIAPLPNMRTAARPPHRFSTERGATACVPGAGGIGPMRDLAAFYEMLLGHGSRGAVPLLKPQTVSQMTARVREGMFDETFRHTMDWGLGLIINSNRYGVETVPYGYGRHASDDTFGHGGSQSSSAFADPERGLVVAIALNGMPGERKHNGRIRDINSAIYEDLGLASAG